MPGEEREVRDEEGREVRDEEERQEEKEGVEKPEEREGEERLEARDEEEGEESGVVVMDLKRSEDSNFANMLLLDYASNISYDFQF